MTSLINPLKQLLNKSHTLKKDSLILPDMSEVTTIILGGGEGKRLFPLTQRCCKPAISFGGRYKLIDIPISNAINSGCKKIFVVTQFLSKSLHRHISKAYSHFGFDRNGVEIISPEQKPNKKTWFEGTADAVRQNLEYFLESPAEYFLILSGDQLYTMDFREMLQVAKKTKADVVIAAQPISEKDCKRMGVLQINKDQMITHFIEKPKDTSLIKEMSLSEEIQAKINIPENEFNHLGSLGIYLFKKEALFELFASDQRDDFGMHLLPTIIAKGNCAAYLFNGYWEDIGTIESFFLANMKLTENNSVFNCYNELKPIYTAHNHLSASKIASSYINNSVICEGSLIEMSEITHSIIGPCTVIQKGCVIKDSYLIGNDQYHRIHKDGFSELLEIGKNTVITKAIIDKNVRIGENVQLINAQGHSNFDGDNIYIRNGIIVVPCDSTIPDGFVL